ncbi:hypothetical protein AAFF_G00211770 [Aldrovandia affinis]|uniref:Gem-associated protein 8 n=1 Tax=Aldrovandia affinis TaxID=143900 RepID=A0AAD7SYP1_9TELE|nr:hypothetical protein AAFF_G00211770 [Aldrovandia affinis]
MDMDQHEDVSWYAHPMYTRYWQHYHQAMAWQQKHRQAYRRAMVAYSCPPFLRLHPAAPPRYSDWHAGEEVGASGDAGLPSRRPSHADKSSESETDEQDTGSDSEIECDVSNMEITKELRQYFAQTEKHREELKKQQEMEQEDVYVLADQDLHRVSWSGAVPPSERPGERRGAEMKKLYGEEAAKIQGMETAMQLTFDRNCDRKQPKYWPVIPLKL